MSHGAFVRNRRSEICRDVCDNIKINLKLLTKSQHYVINKQTLINTGIKKQIWFEINNLRVNIKVCDAWSNN